MNYGKMQLNRMHFIQIISKCNGIDRNLAFQVIFQLILYKEWFTRLKFYHILDNSSIKVGSLKEYQRKTAPIFSCFTLLWALCGTIVKIETVQKYHSSPGVLRYRQLTVFQRRETKPDEPCSCPNTLPRFQTALYQSNRT